MTPDDSVVGLEYVSELESVCVATRKGAVLLCHTHTLEASLYAWESFSPALVALVHS